MNDTQIVKNLVGLESEVNALKIEEEKIEGRIYKMICVSNLKIRVRCPYCKIYTRSVHDYLESIKIKYLKMVEYITYLVIYKRRFNCKNCLKRFAESNYINGVNKTLSNKLI